MENSPPEPKLDDKTHMPSGAVNVAADEPVTSVPTTSEPVDKPAVVATDPVAQPSEEKTWEYEFSYKAHPHDAPGFIIVHDTSIASAIERVICHQQQDIEVRENSLTGNWFFTWDGVAFCIKVNPDRPSASFYCAVDASEKLERRPKPTSTAKVDSVLEGLI